MDLELTHKTALVSGAHRGTGHVIARTLAEEGATVALHAFTQPQADEAMAAITDPALNIVPVVGDLLTDDGAQNEVWRRRIEETHDERNLAQREALTPRVLDVDDNSSERW